MTRGTHGGARPNSGPKPYPIDLDRVKALQKQGLSQRAIAERFGVGRGVIQCALRRAIKQKENAK